MLAALGVFSAMVAGAVPAGAKPTAKLPSLQQLVAHAAALKVRLNLAVAQDSAVKGELHRLDGLVAAQEATVAADRSAAAAADTQVAAAAARLAQLESQGAASA